MKNKIIIIIIINYITNYAKITNHYIVRLQHQN